MADNTTRLKILAQVEGVQGFDSLKRSLQGLAQQGQGTQRDLFRLAAVYKELKSGGDSTISGMRQQVAVLTQLRESVSTTGSLYKRWGAELDQVQGKLRALAQAERGAAQARPAAGGGGIGLMGLAGQYAPQLAVGAAVAGIATAGVSAESAQVRLKALTDQFGEYNEAQAAAARIAGTLRLSTAESQQSFANLYASLRPTGITVKELEDTLIGFSAAARNSGATAQETSNALIQLKQGLASGALQGEELRSIREQAPLAAQAIAKEMGTTIGNLKNLAAEGKVTTDVVIRAMGRLKEEQLGKLNAQFNTAEQAMIDMKNAAMDAGSEISKLFGPTMVAGLRLLTGALKGVNDQLKFYSDTQAALKNYNITPEQELKIRQKADKEAEDIVNRRRIANPFQRNEEYQRVRQEQYKNMIERFRYGSVGLQSKDFALTPEQLADQAAARQERLRAGQAGAGKPEKERVIVLGGVTGGDQPGPSRGRSTGAHLHAQFGPGITEAQAIQLVYKAIDFGAQTPQVGGRRFAGHGYPGLDFPMAASRFTLKPGYTGTDLGIQGALGRGMRISGPGGTFEIGHLRDVTTGKESQRLDEQQKALNESYDAAQRLAQEQQKLAEQRAKEQADHNALVRQERAETKDIEESMRIQLAIDKARTPEERIRLQYTQDYFDTYRNLTKEVEGLVDAESARRRILAVDAQMYQKQEKALRDIAELETARASESWAQQQETLQGTLTSYYQQQADLLGEQNQLAVTLSQSIGQGLQQAFSLAIQGTEDWGASLKNLASGVLQDIAQQLLQIAVITPIVNSIAGIGARGIAPIAPGISALPGGDLTGAFTGGGGMSFTGGLPAATMTPGAFQFATGGIMTPKGAVPLRRYARGGIATAPQAAIYGEGATPEAFVPLPDGRRIPVALRQYPGIPGAPGTSGSFEQTDAVVQRLVETARQESAVRAATGSAAGPDGTMRIQIETTRINSVDYVTAEQAQALAQAAATRSTARQQRALQGSPAARRSVGI